MSVGDRLIDPTPPPGCEPVTPPSVEGGPGSFVSGEPEGERLRVAYFRRVADDAFIGRAWFGPGASGPPGHAHGGSIAAVLDEAMGGAAWIRVAPSLAVHLEIDFRNMLPLGTLTQVEAHVTKAEGRKVWVEATLRGPDRTLFAEAKGLFLTVEGARLASLVERLREAGVAQRP